MRVSLKQRRGTPQPKLSRITLLPYDDIETWPSRGPEDVLTTGDFVLKATAQAIAMYATNSTISRVDTQEGDPDAEGFLQTISYEHPGNAVETEEFIQKYLGKPFVVISEECGDNLGNRIHGWKCNPVFFTVEEQDNNEAVKKTLNWSQRVRSKYKSGIYQGAALDYAPYAEDGSGSAGGGI